MPAPTFLSCLYGSEHPADRGGATKYFLSCLYGSELMIGHVMSGEQFLSCLYGSEHIAIENVV